MKPLRRSAARALVLAAGLGLVGSALAGPVNAAASGGTETITAIPELIGVATSLTLDAATAKTLKSLGVAGAPTGSTKFDAATSTVGFPIISGYAEIHRDHNSNHYCSTSGQNRSSQRLAARLERPTLPYALSAFEVLPMILVLSGEWAI